MMNSSQLIKKISILTGIKKHRIDSIAVNLRANGLLSKYGRGLYAVDMKKDDLIALLLGVFIGGPAKSISDRVNKFINLDDNYAGTKGLGPYLSSTNDLIVKIELFVDPFFVAHVQTDRGVLVFGDNVWDRIKNPIYTKIVKFDGQLLKLIDGFG